MQILYNELKSRGEFMYTAYLIFTIILFLSFITGMVLILVEHEPKKNELVDNHIIVDSEIL